MRPNAPLTQASHTFHLRTSKHFNFLTFSKHSNKSKPVDAKTIDTLERTDSFQERTDLIER